MDRNMFKEKLHNYIDAKVPIIYIESFDDHRIEDILLEVTERRIVVEWNEMDGYLCRKKIEAGEEIKVWREINSHYTLEELLETGVREEELDRRILIIKDIESYLENPRIIALLKNACLRIEAGRLDTTLIFVSPIVKIPKELEKYVTLLQEVYLSTDEIKTVILEFLQEYSSLGEMSEELLEEIAIAFKGLSQLEVETILALAFSSMGKVNRDTINLIIEQKQQIIQKAGILEMIPMKESMEDIGGLENLKEWMQKKAKIMKNIEKAMEYGVELPKGVLVAGVPGCGKSLSAKASAKLLDVPLLKLDMGRIMGKYVGESESNMRHAIALAEAIAPCVLWVDELEKAFAGIGGDSGGAEVTTRLFGQFLTWMQEKSSAVFVVATANRIKQIPPELLRKGRFDEIFYVKLPSSEERKKIFEIHIKKRRKDDLESIDIAKLVDKTSGYSGADIEGVVKEGIASAFVQEASKVTTKHILDAIKNTHSLKEIMGNELDEIEAQYKERKFKSASK